MRNADIRGETSFVDILEHDFWGQNIKLADSHKSYRPITTLTFALNYMHSGLNEYGFHMTNMIIYCIACVLVHQVALRWLNQHGVSLTMNSHFFF